MGSMKGKIKNEGINEACVCMPQQTGGTLVPRCPKAQQLSFPPTPPTCPFVLPEPPQACVWYAVGAHSITAGDNSWISEYCINDGVYSSCLDELGLGAR